MVARLVARSAVWSSNLLYDRIACGALRPVRERQDRISDDLREDDRRRQTFPCARQRSVRHRLERWARNANRFDFHVSDELLRRVDLAHSKDQPWNWR